MAFLVGRERTNDRFPQAEGRGPALSARHPIVPNSSFPRVKAGCRLHETWTLSFIRYQTSIARETSHARRAVLDLVYCTPGCELTQVLDCSLIVLAFVRAGCAGKPWSLPNVSQIGGFVGVRGS